MPHAAMPPDPGAGFGAATGGPDATVPTPATRALA